MTKTLLLALLTSTLRPAALAQASADHSAHHASAPAAAASDFSEAEVSRIDKAAGKFTLKHGEIKSLDMPPMKMVFHVRDKAWLDGLKDGDRIHFKAVREGGRYVVTELKRLP